MTRYFNLILDVNGLPKLARFSMKSLNTAEYRDKARTMKEIAEAMKTSNESLQTAVQALDLAVEKKYFTSEDAQRHFKAELEMRIKLEILPREL